MTTTLIGYARCSTDKQDLAAQKAALEKLGVASERIYTDHGLTGTNRSRPGLDQALAAVRTGDTLVVPKLDRLARSVPDARSIADALVVRGVRLALGSSPSDAPQPAFEGFFLERVIPDPVDGSRLRQMFCARISDVAMADFHAGSATLSLLAPKLAVFGTPEVIGGHLHAIGWTKNLATRIASERLT